MFEISSRYAQIETATYTTSERKAVAYKRRRFLPQGENLPLFVEVTVNANDRLDLITARAIGAPEQFWRVCDANNAMNPFDLIEPGKVLRVAVPQVEVAR